MSQASGSDLVPYDLEIGRTFNQWLKEEDKHTLAKIQWRLTKVMITKILWHHLETRNWLTNQGSSHVPTGLCMTTGIGSPEFSEANYPSQ